MQLIDPNHIGLADALARPFARCDPNSVVDWREVARLALVVAARDYDPARGMAFESFASFRIGCDLKDARRREFTRRTRSLPDCLASMPCPVGPDEVESADSAAAILRRLPAKLRPIVEAVAREGSQGRAAKALGCGQSWVAKSCGRARSILAGAAG